MSENYQLDKEFEGLDALEPGEYEACTFLYGNFGKADLSGIHFLNCEFQDCDLSMAKLRDTALNEVQFINCKLMGIDFGEARKFGLSLAFENCNLNFASFAGQKLEGTEFSRCSMEQCDLVGADLSKADFIDCDLNGALFENTNLTQADFHDSRNFAIDPGQNRVKGATFPREGLEGLLYQFEIRVR